MVNKKHKQIILKYYRFITILITIALLTAACSPSIPVPTLDIQATLAANVSGTLTASAPTPTNLLPTLVSIPANTQVPLPTSIFSGLTAQVNVLNIIMRSGPSTLFEKITSFLQGTQVTIMGKISNNEWVMVKDPQGGSGWMSAQFLSQVDLSGVPSVAVPGSMTITGSVQDMVGLGVDGIDVAVFQSTGSDERRTDTYSGLDGNFTVYLPATSQGIWYVGTVGILCTSRVMDANCNTTGSIITPTNSVALPQTVTLIFQFDPNTP